MATVFAPSEPYYVHIKKTSITKYVGDEFDVETECGVSYYANGEETKPYYFGTKSNILNVNNITGHVVCKNAGEASIIVYLTTDDQPIQKEITVVVSKKVVYPTSLSITNNKVVLTDQRTTVLNPVITDGQNMEYTVSYQNNLVEYDFLTGEVSSKGTHGTETVSIKVYKKNGSYLETSFEVEIKDIIEVEVNDTIKLNETKTFYYDEHMQQSGELVGVPQIEDLTVLEYANSAYGYFNVKGLELGTTRVIVSDGLTKVIFTIEVVEE